MNPEYIIWLYEGQIMPSVVGRVFPSLHNFVLYTQSRGEEE